MATLKIEFKDSKFVSNNEVNVVKMTENEFEGNGWKGRVDEAGNFSFVCVKYYGNQRYQLKFRVSGGYFKKTLKIGESKPIVLKSYYYKQWPADGIIGLSSGVVYERNCYFRTADFQSFLDENDITAVRFEESNGFYKLCQKKEKEGKRTFFFEELQTDGRCNLVSERSSYDDNPQVDSTIKVVELRDASWALKTVWMNGSVSNRILYTLDNPREIVGLPKLYE